MKRATTNGGLVSVKELRAKNWKDVPPSPGVYWWYFPNKHLRKFGLPKDLRLNTRKGYVCLYCGVATNLRERLAWHAAQKLSASALRSRFLSTLRLTLLAVNSYSYQTAYEQINKFMDELLVSWEPTSSRHEAEKIESAELGRVSKFHYPLNIKGNRRTELIEYIRKLRTHRKDYRGNHLVPRS